MPNNICSRKDIYFNSEVYIQNYPEHTISSVGIEYDKNINIKVMQLGKLVIDCLSYIQSDT
jgi:hypothetical protein